MKRSWNSPFFSSELSLLFLLEAHHDVIDHSVLVGLFYEGRSHLHIVMYWQISQNIIRYFLCPFQRIHILLAFQTDTVVFLLYRLALSSVFYEIYMLWLWQCQGMHVVDSQLLEVQIVKSNRPTNRYTSMVQLSKHCIFFLYGTGVVKCNNR